MLYTDKVRTNYDAGKEAASLIVGYTLPFYMQELPERKGGTGIPQWSELNDIQKQVQTSIEPNISNALYYQAQELKKAGKLDAVIALARALDDENLFKALTALEITPAHIALKV